MDRRVELYYGSNGTVEVVSQDSPPPVFSFFITVFCFLCGVSHNLILLSAVLSDEKLRLSTARHMSALLSLACLLDCLTNQSVAVGLLLNNAISWCPLSAALFPLFLLLHAATLALFCLEKIYALCKLPLTLETCVLAELSAWIFSLLFSLPLLAASDVHHFRNRNSCGTVQHGSWAPALYLLGLLLCWSCQAVYLFLVLRPPRLQASFSPIPVSSPTARQTSAPSLPADRMCSGLLLLYALLVVPQTVSTAVTLFLRLDPEPDPWLEPGDSRPRSVSTPDLDLLLTYLRYMYDVAVPVVLLTSDPALRQQARRVFCCSTNTVSSEHSTLTSPTVELRPLKSPGFQTPVLFSTPQGIHLRVARRDASAGDSIRLITRFCDLIDDCSFGRRKDDWRRSEESWRRRSGENLRISGEDWKRSAEDWRRPEEDLRIPGEEWRRPKENLRIPGENWRRSSEDWRSPEEDWRRCGEQRNVRFSSKVEAISLTRITSGTENVPRHSDTRTVLDPVVLLKGETDPRSEVNRTYSKF